MSYDMENVDKRMKERMDKITSMIEEQTEQARLELNNTMRRNMFENERLADEALRQNNPISAAFHQMYADMIRSWIEKDDEDQAKLKQYRKLISG
ncbi:MAG: hypothetical protein ACREBU_15735 [Nitrososphaera sp.]